MKLTSLFSTSTIAQNVAAQFEYDGTRRVDARGRNLLLVCVDYGLKVQAFRRIGDYNIYEFPDGSAIVECHGIWDIRAVGCSRHCWDAVGCCCEVPS